MGLLRFTGLFHVAFTLRTMEKGSPSTPPADSTHGSCLVQNGASQPSPTRTPSSFISDDASESTKPPTSADLQKLPSSSQRSSRASPQQSHSSSDGSQLSSKRPIFEIDFTEDSVLASDQNPVASSQECSPNRIPSFPKETAADLSCSRPADSPSMASASASVSPMKRSFASLAKLVILQEKLRKAQEREEEEDGEISFYLCRGVPVGFACFSRVRVGSLWVSRLPLTVQMHAFGG